MRIIKILLSSYLLLLTACNNGGLFTVKPDVDVEISNISTHDLENAEVHFANYVCGWGFVGKTFTKIYLYYPHPITMDAELSWTESGKQRVEKISLAGIYPVGESGRLTFIVHADRVEARFIKSE